MKRILPVVLAVGLAAAGHASAQTTAQTTSPPGGAAGTGTAGATGAPTTTGSPNNTMGTPGAGGPGAAGALTNPAMPPGAAPVVLPRGAAERLGGRPWLDVAGVDRIVGQLYPLYREPEVHSAPISLEKRVEVVG